MDYKKIKKLTDIAKLYYEQDKTQNEIAKIYEISRPLVSRMLKEAKDFGIVDIKICSPFQQKDFILEQLKRNFPIQEISIVSSGEDDNITNKRLAQETVKCIQNKKGTCFGIGWGTIIGEIASILEKKEPRKGMLQSICPLVGNSGVSNRNYHSNENVRILSQQMQIQPYYLYTPAFAETRQEMELMSQLENYKAVYKKWNEMDIALINIGNYPSVPDFASGARYGQLLVKYQAVGRILAYYYNLHGNIIKSDTDYAIQIPIEILKKCRMVIGVCSSNVNEKALKGALHTGMIHHVIAKEELFQKILE